MVANDGPGRWTYENEYTGERIEWQPTQAAAEDEGASPDLAPPKAAAEPDALDPDFVLALRMATIAAGASSVLKSRSVSASEEARAVRAVTKVVVKSELELQKEAQAQATQRLQQQVAEARRAEAVGVQQQVDEAEACRAQIEGEAVSNEMLRRAAQSSEARA
jgi:hypothetical protein